MKISKPVLANIQLLRAAAALSVAYFHGTKELLLPHSFAFGQFGVDIFFCVSGFIICYVTADGAQHFFAKRLIRIVPFYWTATLILFFAGHLSLDVVHGARGADISTLLTSLFFVPHIHDGAPRPLLTLGWTLNFEMFFYFVFTVAMALNKKFAPLLAAVGIALIYCAVNIFWPRTLAAVYYGNAVAFEFVFGIAVFYVSRWADRAAFTKSSAVALCLLLATSFCVLPVLEHLYGTSDRALYLGIPAALVVLSAILLEKQSRISITSPFLLLLGEASYVLYLTHFYVISAFHRMLARHVDLVGGLRVPGFIAALAFAVAVAVVLHVRFELPIIAVLRRNLLRGRRATISSGPDRPPTSFSASLWP